MEMYPVKITKVVQLTADIRLFYLEKPADLTWQAGSHMHIGLPGFRDGAEPDKGLVRHMSIASLPASGYIMFMTRIPRDKRSRFKEKLATLREGDMVTVFKVSSNLRSFDDKPMLFLSMGVGLAPFLPLWCEALQFSGRAPWHSILVARPGEEALGQMAAQVNLPRLHSVCTANREAYQKALAAYLKNVPDARELRVVIVGSDAFLKGALAALDAIGVASTQIILDKKPELRRYYFPHEG